MDVAKGERQRDRGLLTGLSRVPPSSCPSARGLSGKLTDASLSPPPRRGSRQPSNPCPQSSASVRQHSWPLIPVEYLLDARCVDRLHGLVDPEKWSTPCKGGVVLAETAGTVRGGRGRGEMQEGRRVRRGRGRRGRRNGKRKREKMLTFHQRHFEKLPWWSSG